MKNKHNWLKQSDKYKKYHYYDKSIKMIINLFRFQLFFTEENPEIDLCQYIYHEYKVDLFADHLFIYLVILCLQTTNI